MHLRWPRPRWEIASVWDDGTTSTSSLPRHWFRFTAQQKADLGNTIASNEFTATWTVRRLEP